MMSTLLVDLVKESLNEELYMASQAGLRFDLYITKARYSWMRACVLDGAESSRVESTFFRCLISLLREQRSLPGLHREGRGEAGAG